MYTDSISLFFASINTYSNFFKVKINSPIWLPFVSNEGVLRLVEI
jgi:hypothetical protein